MAYQKLPGIYRKEDQSPAKQANVDYKKFNKLNPDAHVHGGGVKRPKPSKAKTKAGRLERKLYKIGTKAHKSEQKGYKKYLKKNKKINTRDNYLDFMAGGKHHSKRTKRLHKRFEKIEDKLHEAYDRDQPRMMKAGTPPLKQGVLRPYDPEKRPPKRINKKRKVIPKPVPMPDFTPSQKRRKPKPTPMPDTPKEFKRYKVKPEILNRVRN